MNILIIESEVYLSHSISQKLMHIGHSCTMCVKFDEAVLKTQYDVILLSTSSSNEKCFEMINKVYKDAILILLASLSNDTTFNLLKNGAVDYVLKPFIIDQLINKIEHHFSYKMMQLKCRSYEKYLMHRYIDVKNKNINIDSDRIFALFIAKNNDSNFDNVIYDNEHFLTIENYVEHIIRSNQHRISDTDLSKKLGISRKSIWEKRKKYQIIK